MVSAPNSVASLTPSCDFDAACCRPTPEVCNDGRDDDCDMRIDCADTDCRLFPTCMVRDGGVDMGCSMGEIGLAACTNGLDDDCDGRADCSDPDCRPFGPMAECCNGVDDNGDGQIDELTCRCFADTDCAGVGSLDQTCWATTFHVCAPRCNFYGGTAGWVGNDSHLVAAAPNFVPRPSKRDVARAKKLLAEAGHPNGITLPTLYYAPQWPEMARYFQVLQQTVKDAGITLPIEERPTGLVDATVDGADVPSVAAL